jgi:hypothetical protein
VRDLAESESVAAFLESLGALDLGVYRPFRMFAMSVGEPLVLTHWEGAELTIDRRAESRRPIVSSALRESQVERRRRETYASIVGAEDPPPIERLEEFHKSHVPERGTESVCMHREEAGTRSLTRVVVCADEVTVIYHDGPPCTPSPVSALAIPRVLAPREEIR